MNRKLQVSLIFIAVFLAGAVAGGVVSLRMAKGFVPQKAVGDQLMSRRLLERLNLTPEQKAKAEEIYAPLAKLIADNRREYSVEQQKADQAMRALLTPEQIHKFEEHRASQREREQRWQRFSKEQRKKFFDEARKNSPSSPEPAEPAEPAQP